MSCCLSGIKVNSSTVICPHPHRTIWKCPVCCVQSIGGFQPQRHVNYPQHYHISEKAGFIRVRTGDSDLINRLRPMKSWYLWCACKGEELERDWEVEPIEASCLREEEKTHPRDVWPASSPGLYMDMSYSHCTLEKQLTEAGQDVRGRAT